MLKSRQILYFLSKRSRTSAIELTWRNVSERSTAQLYGMLAALLLLSCAGVDAHVEQPGPPDAVFLDLVIDRSGSMQSLGSEPSTQTAKFIRDQIEKVLSACVLRAV